MPQPRSLFARQRTPILLAAFTVGTGLFMTLKWRAVVQRSEAAKAAGSRNAREGVDFAVAPSRSGGGI